MVELIDGRHRELRELVQPLPGSEPYVNRRPIHVPERAAGLPLIEFLVVLKTVQSREDWLRVIATGQLQLNGQPVHAGQILKPGERLIQIIPHTVEPAVNAAIGVLFEDDALVVLNKPAPLPMHPCGRFNRNTLQWILNELFHPIHPRPAHRLDANTTGVVVCAKTRKVAAGLQPQFEQGLVEKTYFARVLGHPAVDEFESTRGISREPLEIGARDVDPDGLPALTRFRVHKRCADGSSLLEAAPRTGRTNQIRIHLRDLGYPIVGDPLYLPGKQMGGRQTLGVDDVPLHLHAAAIGFDHPVTRKRMRIKAPLPDWANVVEASNTAVGVKA